MKKILYIALMAVIVAGCSKQENDPIGNTAENEVRITSGIASRASGTTWHSDDRIGIYMLQNSDKAVLSGNVQHKNSTTEGATATFEVVTASEKLYYPHNGTVDFLAYYPYQTAMADYVYKVDVSDQSDLPKIDLMTASKESVGKTTDVQNLTFDHRLTNVKLNIKAGEGLSVADITDVAVSVIGTSPTADYHISTDAITARATATAITVPQVIAPADATQRTAEAIVIPQADVSGVKFEFTVTGYGKFTATLPSGTTSFDSGKQYIYTITISRFAATITSQNIIDWISGPGDSGMASRYIFETVSIPAGTFMMGSPSDEPYRYSDETLHSVTLSQGFKMSKYEITTAQYAVFLNEVGVAKVGLGENVKYTMSGNKQTLFVVKNETPQWNDATNKWEATSPNSPMTFVTWFGAKAYADWADGALPTEAQWEYACRAGTTTAYSFGADDTDMDKYAWYDTYELKEVGLKLPNAWGLHDMHGNAQEWCSDWYNENYPTSPTTDPKGAASGSNRVIRSGYYFVAAKFCRSATRSYNSYNYTGGTVGFRVVLP